MSTHLFSLNFIVLAPLPTELLKENVLAQSNQTLRCFPPGIPCLPVAVLQVNVNSTLPALVPPPIAAPLLLATESATETLMVLASKLIAAA